MGQHMFKCIQCGEQFCMGVDGVFVSKHDVVKVFGHEQPDGNYCDKCAGVRRNKDGAAFFRDDLIKGGISEYDYSIGKMVFTPFDGDKDA